MGVAEKKHCEELIFRHWRSHKEALFRVDFPLSSEPSARIMRRRFSDMGEVENQRYSERIFRHRRSREKALLSADFPPQA